MCSVKTMIKIALGMGLLLILGYVALPQARPWIGAAAPFLLFLACPLAMYFMMKGKNKRTGQGKQPGQPDGNTGQNSGADHE